MTFLRAVALVAAKDLRVEWRSREQATTLLFFALLVLVVFHFAFDFTVVDFAALGPGILWVAFTFSGILALNRSFEIEREQGRLQGLLLAPVDRGAVYLGKVAATVLFMSAAEAVIVPLAIVLFNHRFSGRVAAAVAVLALNTIGFAAVGTLFAAITTGTRRGALLLPLLLFPATVPLALAAVRTTAHVLAGRPFERYVHWLLLSGAFDMIFLAAAVLLFESVVDD